MARRSVIEGRAGADRRKVAIARQLRREMTPAEDRLWGALCGKALGYRVRNQHVIRGWIVDFYIASARLVIEVDGGTRRARTCATRSRRRGRRASTTRSERRSRICWRGGL